VLVQISTKCRRYNDRCPPAYRRDCGRHVLEHHCDMCALKYRVILCAEVRLPGFY
jgi:hypothetical protein